MSKKNDKQPRARRAKAAPAAKVDLTRPANYKRPKVDLTRPPLYKKRAKSICHLIRTMLMDPRATYDAILWTVKQQFPNAETTARSIASIAATMRKAGAPVPMRGGKKAAA